ncbi:hypothetical protein F5B17DRAFT_350670 [Nemania serpens]|nr:hypothetical protein F5B17DRAFT_350670 [Nemania serpens]
MSTILGKRKSRTKSVERSISQEEAEAKLARLFGAEFDSLLPTAKPTPRTGLEEEAEEQSGSNSDGSDDDSWNGLSEAEAEDASSIPLNVVEVVSHTETYSTTTTTTTNALTKRETRAWLSSRPPVPTSSGDPPSSKNNNNNKGKTTLEEDAPSLLKNDLALQRLLAESHLFSSAEGKGNGDGDATEHVGRNRHLATDLRLSALGSKTSIYKQSKMPMAFRKGIQAAADGREARRRREARENGIVLERPGSGSGSGLGLSSKKSADKGKRKGPSRLIDGPAVGRMSGGMLTLSKRDIADIEGGGGRKGVGLAKKKRR